MIIIKFKNPYPKYKLFIFYLFWDKCILYNLLMSHFPGLNPMSTIRESKVIANQETIANQT